jgi:hypothetical protein
MLSSNPVISPPGSGARHLQRHLGARPDPKRHDHGDRAVGHQLGGLLLRNLRRLEPADRRAERVEQRPRHLAGGAHRGRQPSGVDPGPPPRLPRRHLRGALRGRRWSGQLHLARQPRDPAPKGSAWWAQPGELYGRPSRAESPELHGGGQLRRTTRDQVLHVDGQRSGGAPDDRHSSDTPRGGRSRIQLRPGQHRRVPVVDGDLQRHRLADGDRDLSQRDPDGHPGRGPIFDGHRDRHRRQRNHHPGSALGCSPPTPTS